MKKLTTIDAGEQLLQPGHGKAGRHIGGTADTGQPLLPDFCVKGGKGMGRLGFFTLFPEIAEQIGQSSGLFRIMELLYICLLYTSMVRCGIDSLCLGAGGAFNPYEIR